MSIFNPWSWFTSSNRKKTPQVEEKVVMVVPDNLPPYKSLRMMNSTALVVLNDSTTLSKSGVDATFYDAVKTCKSEVEVVSLFIPAPVIEAKEDNQVETAEERMVVENHLFILESHEDFVVNNGQVYLRDINLPMPAVVAASFMELIEKLSWVEDLEQVDKLTEQYEALKMFWMWASLNPIESSRNDLFGFIRNNSVKITRNGLLEMYRRVVSKGKQDKEFVNFVSNAYYKVKKNKKSPSNYTVLRNTFTDEYVSTANMTGAQFQSQDYEVVGNLTELYNSLPSMSENHYTDNHTKSKLIKVGDVYREDEDKIDLDNTRSCSAGLHVGSHSFMFSGFGDVGVLALVNPSKVRSVPTHECNKMRVSEMFIAAVVDLDEYKKSLSDETINDYSQEYFNASVEELRQALANKDFGQFAVQGNYTALSLLNIDEIKNMLAERVVEVA